MIWSAKLTRCALMKKQNATKVRIGQTPCRKKRDPEKISRKPLTGERINREIKKVSVTAVTPA